MAGGQYSKGACPYAKECVDTLVGTITQPEFKGNMLVIMAGYVDPMDQMFASVNPGFASRFNKRRVHFLPWTAKQAADAVVEEIKKEDRTITDEAIASLRGTQFPCFTSTKLQILTQKTSRSGCCVEMQPLPSGGQRLRMLTYADVC